MSESVMTERQVEQRAADDKTQFGFWVYIMTDCVLFASLFATYAVMHTQTFGGPGAKTLFDLNNVLLETIALLTSSFTMGLAMLSARNKQQSQTRIWLMVTFALGLIFLVLELKEFHALAADGNSWRRSGFLSAFFTLVATHGLHITVGLSWIVAMWLKIGRSGLTRASMRRLGMLSVFWHFLDLVWIFIFTVVYMLGAI